MTEFSNKRALITGAARGIGSSIALDLAERGADVAFTYINSTEAAPGAESMRAQIALGRYGTDKDVAAAVAFQPILTADRTDVRCLPETNFGAPSDGSSSYLEAVCSRSLTVAELIATMTILAIAGIVYLVGSMVEVAPGSSSAASVQNSTTIKPYRCEEHRVFLDHESSRIFDANC